jgi:hypothetical protein
VGSWSSRAAVLKNGEGEGVEELAFPAGAVRVAAPGDSLTWTPFALSVQVASFRRWNCHELMDS